MKHIFSFLFLALVGLSSAHAQHPLQGLITDSLSGEPLPFAHILINGGPMGTTSDLNGEFNLESKVRINSVSIRFIGYEEKTIHLKNTLPITVALARSRNELEEVTIFPGENPADVIMRNVVKHRKENDPEGLKSFSYQAYEKFHFTLIEDSTQNKSSDNDSMANVIRGLINMQHLMLTENVYERKFRNGKYTDNVEATRFSGMKNPEFALLAGQMQSFSFYKDEFKLGEQSFINPVSPQSEKKYFFLIEDTLSIGGDTTIVISYRPKKGKNFKSLKGVLHINMNDFAIRNATANVVDQVGIEISIKHRYEKMGGVWFPTQLNTEFIAHTMDIMGFKIKGVGNTFNREINTEADIKMREISVYSVEIDKHATKFSDEDWAKVRQSPLTAKDSITYHVVDSVGQEFKFERRMNALIAIATGRWPIGPIDLDLDKIVNYNEYEGFRLGIGLHTSPKLSDRFSLGGYIAYGFKDKEPKYGGDVSVLLYKNKAFQFEGAYYHDLLESGGQQFIQKRTPNLREMYRDLLVSKYDMVNGWRAGFSLRPTRGIRLHVAFESQFAISRSGYRFINVENVSDTLSKFQYSEIVVGLHYAPFEKVFRLRSRDLVQDKGNFILWLTATKGLKNVIGSDFDYWKADLRIQGKFKIRKLGKETWQLRAGWNSRDLPYLKMYTPRANYESFSAFSPGSFETMRPNEFVNRYFIAIHHQHNFGTWKTKSDMIQPELNWVNNFSIGWLPGASNITGINVTDNHKGFYETGVVIENILKSAIGGIGGGVFYRYGPYSFPKTGDNFAYMVSLKLGL